MHYTRKELFGNYLKNMRSQFNLTQDTLAERSGVTKSYISKLEHAASDTMPSLTFLERLADTFNEDIDFVQFMAGTWDNDKLQDLIEDCPHWAAILIELSKLQANPQLTVFEVLDLITIALQKKEEPSEEMVLDSL